jgi:hypothetical protein
MIAYVRRHWRGELSLAASWWISGVLCSLPVLAIWFVPVPAGLSTHVDTTLRFSVYAAVITGLVVLLPMWQSVGIWRAANRYGLRGGARWPAPAARVGASLIALIASYEVLTLGPDLWIGSKLAYGFGGYHYKVSVMPGGRAVLLDGGISFGVTKDLERLLAAAPGIRRLVLNSGGGSLTEARKLRRVIVQHQLDTDSTRGCASACVSAYIAGRHRYLHAVAGLGFHLPRNPVRGSGNPVSADFAPELRFFARLGVPRWFIARWIATGHTFWYPAPLQLREAGIVDTYVGGEP